MPKITAGDNFNAWQVVEQAPSRHNNIKHWLCRCVCGNLREVSQYNLVYDRSKNCGCIRVVSEHTRKLLSEANKGVPKRPKGYEHSEEAKAKMKASQLARREREKEQKGKQNAS